MPWWGSAGGEGGGMLDVASWVGIPRAALASLGQAERRSMGGPGVFGTLRGLIQR